MASEGSQSESGDASNYINRCPYCLALMEPRPLEHRLTQRQYAVYATITEAGPDGATHEELIDKCLPGRSAGTLRTCIVGINKLIGPLRLNGRGGRYYLNRVEQQEGSHESNGIDGS